jgi:UDP-2,3-diacylglucosamine pyrophosphatase LpxH
MTINLLDFGPGVLLAADAHCQYKKLDAIKSKHPEITTRFFLGDLFSFTDIKGNPCFTEDNKGAADWLKRNINEWYFTLGNHETAVLREWWRYNLDKEIYDLVAGKFRITWDLQVRDKKYLLVHSKPKSLWDFINPGEYTERDFHEDFPNNEEYTGVIGGHAHRECVHNFVDTDCILYQLGAVRGQNKYAILTDEGVKFKKL